MNEWINDELLSAYLDGEVTAEEQAKIEKLLASQPQARQLLDELRALSGALQSLPPARLEADLSERVIRAAQRQILTGGEAATESTGPGGSLWLQLRKRLTGRALFWPAVAAALALWIVLTDLGRVGDPLHQREVVNAPAPIALKKGPADGDSTNGGMGSNRVAANVGVEAASVGTRGDTALPESTSPLMTAAAAPSQKPPMIGPMAAGEGGDGGLARKPYDESERRHVGSAAVETQNGAAAPDEPPAYADSSAADPLGGRSFYAGRSAEGPVQSGVWAAPPAAAMAAAPLPAADDRKTDGAPATTARKAEGGRHSGIASSVETIMEKVPADSERADSERADSEAADSEAAEEGILVVHVDIAADAARNDVFGQLLAQNFILWEPDPALAGASGWNSLNPLWRTTDANALAGESDAPAARNKEAPTSADSELDGIEAADRKTGENQMAVRESPQPSGASGAAEPADQRGGPLRSGDGRGSIAKAMKGIAVAPSSAATEPGAETLPAASPAADRPAIAKSEGRALGVDPGGASLRALKAPPSPEIELVYVEAQASQIQNLIADLTDAHQSVVSVAVEPARGPQNFSARQRGQSVAQLAQARPLPPSAPDEAISNRGQKQRAGEPPPQPEEDIAVNASAMPVEQSAVPVEQLPKSAPGWQGPLSGAGPAPRQLGEEHSAALAEKERMERKGGRADDDRPEPRIQTDRLPQFGRAAGQGPLGGGAAGGQVVMGRAHRVARLDVQNQVAGQTGKDQMAATAQQGGKAVVEPAEAGSSSAKPGAAFAPMRDGSRQAFVRREAGQAAGPAPSANEVADKAKQNDIGTEHYDLSLVRPGSQTGIPQAARQQRVLFVLRTVPAVQAAASQPPRHAPASAPADATAAPEGDHAAPPGAADGGEPRGGLAPDSAPQ